MTRSTYRWPAAVAHHRERVRQYLGDARRARAEGDMNEHARAMLQLAYTRFWLMDAKTGVFPEAVWLLPEISTR